MELPQLVARRVARHAKGETSPAYVTSIGFAGGKLYDASFGQTNFTRANLKGYVSEVHDTLTGEMIGLAQPYWIMGISELNGRAIAVRHDKDNRGVAAIVYDLLDSKGKIAEVVMRNDILINEQFQLRTGSLDMAIADGKVYVASDNIAQIDLEKGSDSVILTEHLADFIKLASHGTDVVAVHTGNSYLVQVMELPGKKVKAQWPIQKNEQGFGYPRMAALFGDSLVIGGFNPYKADESFSLEEAHNNFYVVPITQGIKESPDAVDIQPQLLLSDGFTVTANYTQGNPLAIVPREVLEELVAKKPAIHADK